MSSASCKIISPTGNGAVANGIGKCNYVFNRTSSVALSSGIKLIGNCSAMGIGDNKRTNSAIKLWTSNLIQVPNDNSGYLTGGQLTDVVKNADGDKKIPILRAKEQSKLKIDQIKQSTGINENNKTETIRKESRPKVLYLCHRCREIFLTAAQFEKHYKQTYELAPVYTCNACEKQLKNRRSFQNHCIRHTKIKELNCTHCSKSFLNEKLLNLHNSNVHNAAAVKKCPECNSEFADLNEYTAHYKTHGDDEKKEERMWQCSTCGKMFKNSGSLSKHSKIHETERRFVCSVCDQKFVQKINLIQHMKFHDVKPHVCSKCGKSFIGESQLQRHQSYHSNIRSFECDVCKKMYKSKRDLRLHRMIHSIQRPHKCPNCEKTFLSTSKLKQHLNIHTGLRPFKCQFCPKDFTNFPNWLKHIRRRHKVDHKTGEKLVDMPKFLKKPNKKSVAKKSIEKIETEPLLLKSIKIEPIDSDVPDEPIELAPNGLKIVNVMSLNVPDRTAPDYGDQLISTLDDMMMFPMVTQQTSPLDTDLSTITVNDKTLPLNNADDLERAASLLMQQTLDIEDEMEFRGAKCEPLDTELYPDESFYVPTNDLPFLEENIDYLPNQLDASFADVSYNVGGGTGDMFSYYFDNNLTMPTVQRNFLSLPPIATVKCRQNQGTHTYTPATNVL